MAIQTSFTIKQVNVDQALKKAEKKAENTAKKIDGVLNNTAGKEIKNLNKGISALGENLGGLGKIAGTLTSKFAIVGAGIAFVVSMIKDLWDRINLSDDEFELKQNFKIQNGKEKTANTIEKQTVDNSYLARLQQLATAENVSNKMKQEAIKLIQLLTKRYGDLGLKIDTVTGQITGLDEAQNSMLKRQAKQLSINLSQELENVATLATKKMGKAFATINMNNAWVEWVAGITYDIFGGMMPNARQGFNQINSMKLQDQIKYLTAFLNERKATFGESIGNNPNIRTDKQIKAITEIIQLKKQQLKIQQKLNSLQENGTLNEKDYAQRLKDQTIKNKVAQNQNIQVQEGRKQTNIDDAMLQMQEQADYQKLTKTSQQLIFLQKKLNEEKQKHKNLSSAVAEIEGRTYDDDSSRRRDKIRISDIQKRIDKLKELQKQGVIIPPEVKQLERLQKQLGNLQTKIYPHDQDRSNALAAISKLETQIKQNEKQQLKIKIQIQKLEEKSNKFYEDRINAYDAQLAVQKLILQGKFQQAQKQRLINQLNQQGLKINEKKIKQDEAKRKELAQVNADIQLQNDAKRLLDKYSPKTKDYRIQKRIEQIEESNKVKLTDEQKGKVKSLVEAEIKLEKLQIEKPNLSRYQIQTNQLTARGGFQGGAVAFGKEQVNTEIKNYAAKQTNLLSQIKSILQNGGLI